MYDHNLYPLTSSHNLPLFNNVQKILIFKDFIVYFAQKTVK